MKLLNKQILKVTALYVMWNPEICQDPPTCGQDDLVLSSKKFVKKIRQKNSSKKFVKKFVKRLESVKKFVIKYFNLF